MGEGTRMPLAESAKFNKDFMPFLATVAAFACGIPFVFPIPKVAPVTPYNAL